ncbi:type II toxin-antitoxin system Phd/YefM family antitoxin [Mycobacterium shinjukuense]|uniref:Antitoxin n=1 Tax=Mycobacterium shinjukuense TaxID=398694 RepID=A0A7I7MME1_9MYCO|nr:type II toxin-antitoxin system Phd/YefM family antitoxin [Mycobacterium shinjukuense]MCV6986760.1 type II toxin-antitoxin system Phd/YefM family antitoxin [Mycobacterium shinjukuense]ORB64915.1 hypothetical protein BST45_15860 [Mycobacterium shinjukuense]BBX72489.1 hypothetical protein MSHI_03950 [Mycobacterium shinjukuense]
METVGIRELRQNASQVIAAAENGVSYRVTNHGQDTGVIITKYPSRTEPGPPTGTTPDLITRSGIYDQPRPPGYEDALLQIVERGRDQAGRVGE